MQNLKEIYYSSNLNPIPNPDLLFLSAVGLLRICMQCRVRPSSIVGAPTPAKSD